MDLCKQPIIFCIMGLLMRESSQKYVNEVTSISVMPFNQLHFKTNNLMNHLSLNIEGELNPFQTLSLCVCV